MKDRVAGKPNTYQITPLNGGEIYEAEITRADEPLDEGTPFATHTMLRDATAALLGLDPDAVPDDAFAVIGDFLREAILNGALSIEKGGTGGTTAETARGKLGLGKTDTVTFGKVIGAVYQ